MFGVEKMRFVAILFAILSSCGTALAQQNGKAGKNDVTVGAATVYRDSRTLVIEYDIDLGENITSCDVELLMSNNGGRSFDPVAITDNLTGDIGRITESGHKTIVYNIEPIKRQLAGKQLAFKVNVRNKKKVQDNKGKFFVMGTVSTFGMGGLKTGYVKKFGGYVSYSDAFYGGMFNSWAVTAGGMMRATSWLYPYVGAGYGQLDFISKFYDLIPFEAGTMFKLGPISLSAAAKPILVWREGVACTFEFGIGFCF